MRRGMTPEALKRFMLEQGPSKNTNLMEWDKIWAINRNRLDPISVRYVSVSKVKTSVINLTNYEGDEV
jgi:glutamyl-tRNA synthetase